MLKKNLAWAGTWIAVVALAAGCRDPGPGAAPPTPAQSAGDTTRSATLSWEAPTTNTNGTALTDLAGYRIYYGSSPEHLSHSQKISTIGLQTYVIEDLEPGTWYFAVMAVAANGAESKLSNVAIKTIT
jgi:Fibronectin type III domain